MRGKLATRLRRLAEAHTVGQHNVEYVEYRGTRRLHPRCTRSAYLRIKYPLRWHRDEMMRG